MLKITSWVLNQCIKIKFWYGVQKLLILRKNKIAKNLRNKLNK